MAVRRYTGLSLNATGPNSFHHWMNFGCHDSSARCNRRSPARSTLLGILASMSTVLIFSMRLHPCSVVRGTFPAAEAAQGTLGANGVRSLEDPVLPRRETGEDLGLHGLGTGKAQAGLHACERVGRE